MELAVRTLYANIFLLSGPQGRLLVDAGALPYAPLFSQIMRDFQPDALLLTHAHVDHAGGAFVAARRGVRIFAHPLEHAQLTGEVHDLPYPAGRPWVGEIVSRLHPKLKASDVRSVFPGEIVCGWEVVGLPGHTAGQVGLLHNGVLIAADAVVGSPEGAHLPRAAYNADHVQAGKTLKTIAEMDLRCVLPAHGGLLTPEQIRARAQWDSGAGP
ncbi:MBL fold metallo-hydrolase [Deinococcus deserti]|uniref:Putative Metallo-beta-lactamase superfamily protein n=1 Tax=Deinococcus deserti (strain DSM 17065 / CIP 109153 / LMG 22923 / VCD115) TaxID=546414 RepID=C1CVK7_DEIDV|nr:MBL fold metallo-hydrolase [Deinococcus deserti]ACO46224.1 putative Metallo-beta-lactamase superfamily protein [Deinococcus deserti VCD115]